MTIACDCAALAEPVEVTHHTLSISGTQFVLDDHPFPYTGISFFNALYNPTFYKSSDDRIAWLRKFKRYGINVLRVWCQWDNKRGFVDAGPESTLYAPGGTLRPEPLARLKDLLADADREQMAIELVLFCQESWHDWIRLAPADADAAVAALTRELQPYRNVTFQIWNEFSERVPDHVRTIKSIDAKRLVTNSPGVAGNLGDDEQNKLLDYLTPHTTRQGPAGRHWEIAPREIEKLLKTYHKPVVDDEPARCGTNKYGGPKGATSPNDHILQIYAVWQLGGYVTYHHDMFQTGYDTPATPPTGIPDPEFSAYHRQVLEFLAQRERYIPKTAKTRPAGE
jgi:hypothetical protein